mgnify:CR=1 FL=1
MLFEKIGIMLFMFILLYILSYNYLKKYAPENAFVIVFLVASFVLYITFAIYDIFIPIYAQIAILLFGIIIPSIVVVLQSKNIIIAKKIIYYKMKSAYNVKDYRLTLKYINKLVILDGRNNELLYLAGMCYKGLKDFINSRDSFALAIEFDDKDYKSYYEYGIVLDSTNKKEAALLMFDKAIKCKPDFYEAKEAKGICLTSQGRFLEAIFSYNEAVKIHKDAYEMYYNIGMLEQEVENFDKAEEAFRKAEQIKPEFLLASYNVGELCLRKGSYEEAINEYKKVTTSMTYGPKAYYKISVCYALLKEYEKAMAVLEYAVELDEEFIKKASAECAFLPMRDIINSYIKARQDAKQKEIDKRNYMKNKIIRFFKKDEPNSLEKFKIAK